jgi:hypothetical protein
MLFKKKKKPTDNFKIEESEFWTYTTLLTTSTYTFLSRVLERPTSVNKLFTD